MGAEGQCRGGKLAMPAVRVALPSEVVPSMKVTEPVGVPVPG